MASTVQPYNGILCGHKRELLSHAKGGTSPENMVSSVRSQSVRTTHDSIPTKVQDRKLWETESIAQSYGLGAAGGNYRAARV